MVKDKKAELKVQKFGKVEYLLPLLHFLASFFYEWTILQLHPAKYTVTAVAKSAKYSDQFERVMAYGISKLFAALIIWGSWKLFFYVLRNLRKKFSIRLFAIFFAVGAFVILLLWPNGFTHSIDNYVTFTYAIRLYPEYWHSAYTSILFTACMMVIPHPFAISFFQWLAFSFVLGYLFVRLEAMSTWRKGVKWFAFLIFLLPEVVILFSDAYRTELYALLCMFYMTKIIFDILEQKCHSSMELVAMALLSAFVAVWRTEGILLGGMGYLAMLLFSKESSIKKGLKWFAVFVVAFFMISFPQKVGNEKYYGSDYSIINSFFVLKNVFNRADANLNYEGAQEDLAAIEAVVPIEAIQAYGLDGYRRYNYENGHQDINQSLTDREAGKAYVKAFYRIVFHNPVIYAQTQLGLLKVVLCLRTEPYVEGSTIILSREYPNWRFQAWEDGNEDLLSFFAVRRWQEWNPRKQFAEGFLVWTSKIADWKKKIYLSSLILIAIPLLNFWILVRDAWNFLKKPKAEKNFMELCFAFLAMMLLGQFAIITLVMPERSFSYFCAVYFCSFILQLCYFGKAVSREKSERPQEVA
ncbi:MAG: hypothetical protein IKO41_16910 [Lachnospiraceae bacterium]|nr:hypothetical protein [Lachnospiraceae bacterium]